jgi:hypothetical protein
MYSWYSVTMISSVEIAMERRSPEPTCASLLFVYQLILHLTATIEHLHAENSILKILLQAAIDILSARKKQKKGIRVSLKDQLLLTIDQAFATAEHAAAEKIKQGKRTGTWRRKQKGEGG